MERLYTAKATSMGGRTGCVKTDDGVIAMTMCMPGDQSGYKSDKCTNPEQLFACAYAVCYHSALKLILKKKRLPFDDTRVDIAVNLNARDNGHFLSVDMNVYIPGVDKEKAKNAIHLAHEICPYSKAIRNNVDVTFKVVDS